MSVALPGERDSAARGPLGAARSAVGVALALLGIWLRRLAAWLYGALPAVAAGLAASIPVLTSTVHAVSAGWEPAGDDGIILTRAWDVLTAHSPLVGQYSEAGNLTGLIVHSPGPLLYWLLALPARFGSTASVAVTMGAFNTLAIVACVALARRRGGPVLMFATAAGIALMCQSLPAEAFHDVWNPAAGLFPLLLLIFLCWSVACGDHRLLPVTALVASFVTQTHLTYFAPAAGMVVIAVAGLVGVRFARRRAVASPRQPAAADQRRDRRRSKPIWRWVLAAALVTGVCWTPPLIDELEHSPGNLTLIVAAAHDRGTTLGAAVGWNAVVRAVGWKPWWLFVPNSEWNRRFDVRTSASAGATATAVVALLALALLAFAGFIRRRRDLSAAALIGLVLCAALYANIEQTPTVPLLAGTIGYTAWWGSMLGLWVWLVLAWALWLALRHSALANTRLRAGLARRRSRLSARLLALGGTASLIACVGAVAATAASVAGTQRPDSHARQYRPIAEIAKRLDQILPPNETVRLELSSANVSTQPIEPGVRYNLVRHGDLVLSRGALPRLGTHYELGDKTYRWLVVIGDGSASRNDMLLALSTHFKDAWGQHTFSAWVARVGPGGRLTLPPARR